MTDKVVNYLEVEPGIVEVTMQDRIYKNALREELVTGLIQCFEEIKMNTAYRVVILTGYDSYFCSGGSKEGLLSIQAGQLQFTDLQLHSLALDCPIPVISAMQGHGIGAGTTLGLFADFVILSRESIYSCNYMKYGFTPGMGATYIVPRKLGISLAEELLFTAGSYSGGELEKRGVPFPVLPRKEVLEHAYQLARKVADKPRTSLITLKNNLVAQIRQQLPEAIEQELIMHEQTMHQAEVKERIDLLFGR